MATQIVHSLFDNGPKICKDCHRMLPKDYTDEVCPACKERELFSKVKDFIRENDVTEGSNIKNCILQRSNLYTVSSVVSRLHLVHFVRSASVSCLLPEV